MNTLSTNSILENLNAWKDYKDNINSVIDKNEIAVTPAP